MPRQPPPTFAQLAPSPSDIASWETRAVLLYQKVKFLCYCFYYLLSSPQKSLPPQALTRLLFPPKRLQKFWVSKEGANYTLGFKAVAAGEYLLAIWHLKDLTQTPIWWAAIGDQPAIANQWATFLYDENSGLLELQNSAAMSIWRSDTLNSSNGVQFLETGQHAH
ncbi:hypothetical protein GOP47_0000555 [Adiantum capillus-veneris]|uniref:Bulb-type lectin domain-containing protein n=1 Tax=Adiantum capillus-veneris TaxID=13818 RepID=A0A9D4ZSF2_ADICA|nr:hypothetical protein GOP47_0000555 [Adiantum capillus-veneris]